MSPQVETPKVEERVERGSDLYLERLAVEFLKDMSYLTDSLRPGVRSPLLFRREDLRLLGKVLDAAGLYLKKTHGKFHVVGSVGAEIHEIDGKLRLTLELPPEKIDLSKFEQIPGVSAEIDGEVYSWDDEPTGEVYLVVSLPAPTSLDLEDASKLLKATIESYQDAFEKVESAISDLKDTLKLLDDIHMYLRRFDVEDQPSEDSFGQAIAMGEVLGRNFWELRHILTGEGPQGYVPADLPSIERFMATVSEFYKLLYTLSRKLRPLTDSKEIEETMTRASERLVERDILAFPTIFLGDRS